MAELYPHNVTAVTAHIFKPINQNKTWIDAEYTSITLLPNNIFDCHVGPFSLTGFTLLCFILQIWEQTDYFSSFLNPSATIHQAFITQSDIILSDIKCEKDFIRPFHSVTCSVAALRLQFWPSIIKHKYDSCKHWNDSPTLLIQL